MLEACDQDAHIGSLLRTYSKHGSLDPGAGPEGQEGIHILFNQVPPWEDMTGEKDSWPAASATQNHL